MNPTISVALCTFNGARFLQQQLDSIAQQTRLPDELVIDDDGSTDGTIEIIERFTAAAGFEVSLQVNPERLGVIRNFGAAIARCRGELIALCDQDDVWLPEKLQYVADYFAAHPAVTAVFTDAYLMEGQEVNYAVKRPGRLWAAISFSKKERRLVASGRAMEVLADRYVVTGATLVFRRELLREVLPMPTNAPPDLWHDGWIALTAASTGELQALERPTIFYRTHLEQQAGLPEGASRWKRLLEGLHGGRVRLDEKMHDRLRDREATASLLIERLGAERARADLFEAKIEHLRNRLQLPERRIARVAPVLSELFAGRYHRFSQRPWAVAARDVLLTH